jgi:hypothetical protein
MSLLISSFSLLRSQRLLISLMSERRQAADDEEIAIYNEQIEDIKVTIETAKQMEAAASRSATSIEKRNTYIEASQTTPSRSGGDAANRRRRRIGSPVGSVPAHATNRSRDTTPESSSRSTTPTNTTPST